MPDTNRSSGFIAKMLAVSAALALIAGGGVVAAYTMGAEGARKCVDGSLDLKGKGMLTGVYTDGANTRLLLRPFADQVQVVTIDTCSGKLLGALMISADTPEAAAAAAAAGKSAPAQ